MLCFYVGDLPRRALQVDQYRVRTRSVAKNYMGEYLDCQHVFLNTALNLIHKPAPLLHKMTVFQHAFEVLYENNYIISYVLMLEIGSCLHRYSQHVHVATSCNRSPLKSPFLGQFRQLRTRPQITSADCEAIKPSLQFQVYLDENAGNVPACLSFP
jgi:hypothetical protein